jgi:hypothetical protein
VRDPHQREALVTALDLAEGPDVAAAVLRVEVPGVLDEVTADVGTVADDSHRDAVDDAGPVGDPDDLTTVLVAVDAVRDDQWSGRVPVLTGTVPA